MLLTPPDAASAALTVSTPGGLAAHLLTARLCAPRLALWIGVRSAAATAAAKPRCVLYVSHGAFGYFITNVSLSAHSD